MWMSQKINSSSASNTRVFDVPRCKRALYIYVYAYMYMYVYIIMFICIYICILIYIYLCIYNVHIYLGIYTNISMQKSLHIYDSARERLRRRGGGGYERNAPMRPMYSQKRHRYVQKRPIKETCKETPDTPGRMYMFTCTHIYMCVYAYMRIHIHIGMYVHTHTRMYILICIYISVHVHTYIHTYAREHLWERDKQREIWMVHAAHHNAFFIFFFFEHHVAVKRILSSIPK